MLEPALPDEQADEVAALLLRIYEIHDVVIAETGGTAIPVLGLFPSLAFFRESHSACEGLLNASRPS